MSELITTHARADFRWRLLTTVSALSLLTICGAPAARAEDAARPTVWLEFGGQLEHVDGEEAPFAPSFLTPLPSFISQSPLDIERPARYSYGAEGKVLFQPEGSDWNLSVGVRYGRSMANRRVHEQTQGAVIILPSGVTHHLYQVNRSDTRVKNDESHAILDFQAGKDIGLGVFGRHATSNLNLGVRYAQFSSSSDSKLQVAPSGLSGTYTFFQYLFLPSSRLAQHFHTASAHSTRGFRGVGPSVSWNASADLAGTAGDAEVTFNWGVNAAVLFGRQKAHVHHQTVDVYNIHIPGGVPHYSTSVLPPGDSVRSRSVVVPNVGGFAGFSLEFPNAKVSLGYRADIFFGAMDGGIDTRKTYDRDFYGPFATISIGLGG